MADGLFAIIWRFLGDMEFYGDFYGFPRTTALQPCGWCPVDSIDDSLPWTDFRTPRPSWLSRFYTVATWAARFHEPNALLTLPGVSFQSVEPDWMHCKYLGMDKYFLGSVLYVMCHILLPGGTAKIKRKYTSCCRNLVDIDI